MHEPIDITGNYMYMNDYKSTVGYDISCGPHRVALPLAFPLTARSTRLG